MSQKPSVQSQINAYTGGALKLSGYSLRGITMPSPIDGSLYLKDCDISGVTMPKTVKRSIYISDCNLYNVELPEVVEGYFHIFRCKLAGVTMPSYVGGLRDIDRPDFKKVRMPSTLNGVALPTASQQQKNLVAVARAALLTAGNSLEMRDVHTCETTHCMAGWVCILDPQGREMESRLGWETAGLILLGEEAHNMFYTDNQTATTFLQSVLQRESLQQ
jgi:hypothetical protein